MIEFDDDGDDESNLLAVSSQPKSNVQLILDALRNHVCSEHFQRPYVSDDYVEVITKPMDLGSIQEKIDAGEFSDSDFDEHVELIFSNCEEFNLPLRESAYGTLEVIEDGRALKRFYREQKQKFKFCDEYSDSDAEKKLQKFEQDETEADKDDDDIQRFFFKGGFAKNCDDIYRDVHTTEDEKLDVEVKHKDEQKRCKILKRFPSVDVEYDDSTLAQLDSRLTELNAELKQKLEQAEGKIKELKQQYESKRGTIRTRIENIHKKKAPIFLQQRKNQLAKDREQRQARLTLQFSK